MKQIKPPIIPENPELARQVTIRLVVKPKPGWISERIWLWFAGRFIYVEKVYNWNKQ